MSISYTISELAKAFDMTTRAIRFYESEGLVSPTRSGRNRVYSSRDRIRLKLIKRGKRMGFSLSEIGDMLDMYDEGPGEARQLTFFLDKIDHRRQMLIDQRDDIEHTLQDLNRIEAQCRDRLRQL